MALDLEPVYSLEGGHTVHRPATMDQVVALRAHQLQLGGIPVEAPYTSQIQMILIRGIKNVWRLRIYSPLILPLLYSKETRIMYSYSYSKAISLEKCSKQPF